jgi:hypothetical protein
MGPLVRPSASGWLVNLCDFDLFCVASQAKAAWLASHQSGSGGLFPEGSRGPLKPALSAWELLKLMGMCLVPCEFRGHERSGVSFGRLP